MVKGILIKTDFCSLHLHPVCLFFLFLLPWEGIFPHILMKVWKDGKKIALLILSSDYGCFGVSVSFFCFALLTAGHRWFAFKSIDLLYFLRQTGKEGTGISN